MYRYLPDDTLQWFELVEFFLRVWSSLLLLAESYANFTGPLSYCLHRKSCQWH